MKKMKWILGASALIVAITGAAIGAALQTPVKAELRADAISIGTGLEREWYLGGFSDLHPEGASGKEFWTLTDRGPNLDGGAGRSLCPQSPRNTKVYALPGFAPEIVRVGVKDEAIKVKARIPLRFPLGQAVGYSVRPTPKNEASVNASCLPLGTSPRGIDSEGLVVDPRDGSFWIADEYLPSVLHVAKDGTVLTRVVPTGTQDAAAGSGATVVAAFPETVGVNFRTNRGFEGLAISPDGRTVYTALQSPMDYRPAVPVPDPRNSLALRVFRLDITDAATPAVTGQWIYRLDKAAGNGPLADKVSTLTWLGIDRLAVGERDDPASESDNPQNTINTRLYVADFSRATPIAPGSVWNGPTDEAPGGKSLEQWYVPGQGALESLPASAPKCLWADVAKLLRDAGITDPNDSSVRPRAGNGKIEGVAYIPARGANPAVLGVINDNDFGLVEPIPEQLDLLTAPAVCTPA